MSHVYRRPPRVQYLQRRPRIFNQGTPPVGGWTSTSGDLLLSVMEAASENEVYHVESVTTGTTTWSHNGSIREIIVLGMHLNFLQTVLPDNVDGDDKTVRLPQVSDPVYFNP